MTSRYVSLQLNLELAFSTLRTELEFMRRLTDDELLARREEVARVFDLIDLIGREMAQFGAANEVLARVAKLMPAAGSA